MRNARVPLLLAAVLALAAVGSILTPAVQSGIVRHLLRRSVDPAAELGSAQISWDGGVRLSDLRLSLPELRLTVSEAEVRVRPGSLLENGPPEFRELSLRGCVLEPADAVRTGRAGWEALRAIMVGGVAPARLNAEGELRLPAAAGVIGFRAAGEGRAAGGTGTLRVEFVLRPAEASLLRLRAGCRLGLPAARPRTPCAQRWTRGCTGKAGPGS